MALAYQRVLKPSASARWAWRTMASGVVPKPGNPMRMGRSLASRRHAGSVDGKLGR